FLMDPLPSLLDGSISLEQYLWLDESYFQMTMMQWTKEKDAILADLSQRFLHRRLFKYITLDQLDEEWIAEVKEQFKNAGINPKYYVEVDSPKDMPYDIYQPGESEEKLPILLLDEYNRLTEVSRLSAIIRSISGVHRGQYRLYYPMELLQQASSAMFSDEIRKQ